MPDFKMMATFLHSQPLCVDYKPGREQVLYFVGQARLLWWRISGENLDWEESIGQEKAKPD
jgi:hypothetical protein